MKHQSLYSYVRIHTIIQYINVFGELAAIAVASCSKINNSLEWCSNLQLICMLHPYICTYVACAK